MRLEIAGRVALGATMVALAIPAASEETALRTFFRRTIGLTEAQIAEVDAGRVVTRQLPGADKPEMAAFGAVRVTSSKDTFLQRLRDVARFRQGPPSLQIGRFHTPPVPADLDGLTLEDGDFDAARQCKPGDCDLKLARSALERIRREIDWKAADARARASGLMKQMLVDYLGAYQRGGTAEMATYIDSSVPLDTPAEFRKVLAASPYLVQYAPELQRYLEEYPKGAPAGAEDFFYWTKDKFGRGLQADLREPLLPGRPRPHRARGRAGHDRRLLPRGPLPRARGSADGHAVRRPAGKDPRGHRAGRGRRAEEGEAARRSPIERNATDTVSRLEAVARSVCHQTVGHHSSADAANKSTTSAVHEKSLAPFPSPVAGW